MPPAKGAEKDASLVSVSQLPEKCATEHISISEKLNDLSAYLTLFILLLDTLLAKICLKHVLKRAILHYKLFLLYLKQKEKTNQPQIIWPWHAW